MRRLPDWTRLTAAQQLDPQSVRQRAALAGALVLGFVGFSRGLAPTERARVRLAVRWTLAEASGPVWAVSGATDVGVPAEVHAEATALGVLSVGLTAAAAAAYRLAALDILVVVGRAFGDESPVFLQTCDAFVAVGGGPQAAAELRGACALGKPVTVWRGLGGLVDGLGPADLPGARWRLLPD